MRQLRPEAVRMLGRAAVCGAALCAALGLVAAEPAGEPSASRSLIERFQKRRQQLVEGRDADRPAEVADRRADDPPASGEAGSASAGSGRRNAVAAPASPPPPLVPALPPLHSIAPELPGLAPPVAGSPADPNEDAAEVSISAPRKGPAKIEITRSAPRPVPATPAPVRPAVVPTPAVAATPKPLPTPANAKPLHSEPAALPFAAKPNAPESAYDAQAKVIPVPRPAATESARKVPEFGTKGDGPAPKASKPGAKISQIELPVPEEGPGIAPRLLPGTAAEVPLAEPVPVPEAAKPLLPEPQAGPSIAAGQAKSLPAAGGTESSAAVVGKAPATGPAIGKVPPVAGGTASAEAPSPAVGPRPEGSGVASSRSQVAETAPTPPAALPGTAGAVSAVPQPNAATQPNAVPAAPAERPTASVTAPASGKLRLDVYGPQRFSVGQTLTFRLQVHNEGPADVETAHLEVLLPPQAVLKSCEPALIEGRQAWRLDGLKVRESREFVVKFACGKAVDAEFEAWIYGPHIVRTPLAVVEPELELAVSTDTKLAVGVPSKVVIDVKNRGQGSAEELEIIPAFGPGLRDRREHWGPLKLGSLAGGESTKVEIPVEVLGGALPRVEIHARGAGGLEKQLSAKLSVVQPKLRVTPRHADVQRTGEIEGFAIEFANEGSVSICDLTLIVSLDEPLQLVDADGASQRDDRNRLLGWELAELAPGQTKTLRWWAVARRSGPLKQKIFIEASGNLRSEGTLTTEAQDAAGVTVQATHQRNPISVGEEALWQIRVFNHSRQAARQVILEAELPPELQNLSRDGLAAGVVGKVEFPAIEELPAGEGTVFQLRAKARREGTFPVIFRLRSNSPDGPRGETRAEIEVLPAGNASGTR